MNDLIRRWIANRPAGLGPQLAIGAGCVLLAVVARVLLAPWLGQGVPYITLFPAITLAAALGGVRAGVICLVGGAMLTTYLFVAPTDRRVMDVAGMAGMAVFLFSGGLILWISHLLTQTVRDLAAANRQEHQLVLELQHRVKNTLAVVQGIAAQTFRAGDDPAWFKDAFTERLIALGRAHNLLSDAAWGPVTLRALAAGATSPFREPGDERLRIDGDDVALPADLVVDLALCLHELATNATKYGALATPGGRVELGWRRSGHRLELEWREQGGPPVAPPARRGFGSNLLERGLSRRFHPEVSLEYPPEGLRWRAAFDVA